MTEMQWRVCAGYADYEVSECGDVRRASHVANQPGRRLRGCIDADGYVCFSLTDEAGNKRWVRANRLVALAFIGPAPTPDHEVAHNNGSRLHNMPDNLRWATAKSNQADRKAHGTSPAGVANGRATISDDDVRYIRRRYREIKLARGKVSELDQQFNLTRSTIIRIARGQSWGHVQ
ncbi:MAG: HNH endonuclease [Novosphingobium sp.]|nr:HNH endonuclease [Novosphingobium sp.]